MPIKVSDTAMPTKFLVGCIYLEIDLKLVQREKEERKERRKREKWAALDPSWV